MAIQHPIAVPANLDDFSTWLTARKGLAATTVANQVGTIRRLALGADSTESGVYRLVAELRERGVSYAHLVNSIRAIEQYMEFLGRPVRLGRPRKPRRLLTATLSEAEIARLLAAVPALRDQAILALLAYSGIRNAELCTLHVEDIDLGAGLIKVQIGKGQRAYAACIAGSCIDLLARYLRERNAGPAELLFLTARRHLPLEPQDLRKLVRRAAERAGLSKRVYPHLFRHSLAMNMLNRGAHVFTIQQQLGHAFVDTTLIYLRAQYQRAKSEYSLCAPAYL